MPDCKHGVNIRSSDLLTSDLNALFTVFDVSRQKPSDPVAEFALGLGKKQFGSIAAFSVALFGDDRRQQVGQWLTRGLPAKEQVTVARVLGLTVEQLLAAGETPVEEPPLSPEAVEFALEWAALPPLVRTQIQGLVRSLPKETGRVERTTRAAERPELQRDRRS
jgi:hypothetical protein